ncbi:MAG TPA: prolyl oligopeptidase family serine peptidase [Phycisphaerae bacterium]|nr:prolyl oligopeptidase family serine peptidase [Phycisphaerae bacterium]
MKVVTTAWVSAMAAIFLMGSAMNDQIAAGAEEAAATQTAETPADPFLWLEDVTGEKAMEWVHAQNAVSTKAIESDPMYAPMRERVLSILNSKERIPHVVKHGKYLYNFWRDGEHVRGLWRRTTMEEYRKEQPAWETVIDLDELAGSEKENWVWHGENVLEPSYDRCLVMLSRGGADADVVREFDLEKKAFVEDGFKLPEAKQNVTWRNRDALYVGSDFGPGTTTDSGYPRIIKEWKRGTALADGSTVFEGKRADVSVSPIVDHDHGRVYEFMRREPTFFTNETFVRRGTEWEKIDKPADAEVDTFGDNLLLRLKSDWAVGGKTYRAGTLLTEDFDAYMRGERRLTELFVPTERTSLESMDATKSYLILNELDNVSSKPVLLKQVGGKWERTALEAPALGSVSVSGVDAEESDDYFMTADGYLTPPTLYLGRAGAEGREKLKSLPAFFNGGGLQVEQFEATSKDGTQIPYYQIGPKGLKLDGSNPTLVYGYGGFEIPLTPGYNPVAGVSWLEKGGVYVVANIRGGGEFGPAWHNAARKEHRQRAYDDFIAVSEDLIARKVTSTPHLGIQGGSNGGLLMGVMLTERPDLFGAVVCQAPLLDMRRYNKLLAGASWMDEFGNPDKAEDWSYLRKFSPYQNVRADVKYPPVLFTTSTRDDRVHPGHARKMAALLESEGSNVLFYENTEGGHAGAANNNEIAKMRALAYTFLWEKLR